MLGLKMCSSLFGVEARNVAFFGSFDVFGVWFVLPDPAKSFGSLDLKLRIGRDFFISVKFVRCIFTNGSFTAAVDAHGPFIGTLFVVVVVFFSLAELFRTKILKL